MDWEVEMVSTCTWSDRPAQRSFHRRAAGARVGLQVGLFSSFQFTVIEDPVTGMVEQDAVVKTGLYGGKIHRPVYRVEQIDVKAWHRLYARRALTWAYRVLTANNVTGFRIEQKIPADPTDPDSWVQASARCFWDGLPIRLGKYARETVGVHYTGLEEPIGLDERQPFFFWVEGTPVPTASGDYGIALDPAFPLVLIGDRGSV